MFSYALLTTETIEIKKDSQVIEKKLGRLRNTMNILSEIITNHTGNGMDYTKIKENNIKKKISIFKEYQKKLLIMIKIQTNTIQAEAIHMEMVETVI